MEREAIGRVPPMCSARKLVIGVLRIVDENVNALTQFTDAVRNLAIRRLLVVADIGHRPDRRVHTETNGWPDMWHRPHHHRGRTERHLAVHGVMKLESSWKRVKADRKQRRTDRCAQRLTRMSTIVGWRGEDLQPPLCGEQRREERQPLNMIPMEVSKQTHSVEGPVCRSVSRTGAHIEQDRRNIGRG